MKFILLLLITVCSLSLPAQVSNKTIQRSKAGKVIIDSGYVYWLPYSCGSIYLLIQGSKGRLSHRNELALDFKMKKGSRVCAAREGIVVEIKKDSNKRGLKKKYISEGNHVIIRHEDGSFARYWHLQKDRVFVNAGDTVSKGQLIGLSGNTGYSAFSHLHFQVKDKNGMDMLPRFLTIKGIKHLRPGRWYRSIHVRSGA
jgi:murein DD-endopeptidase MepM/ murein hydrolase activator NlpD